LYSYFDSDSDSDPNYDPNSDPNSDQTCPDDPYHLINKYTPTPTTTSITIKELAMDEILFFHWYYEQLIKHNILDCYGSMHLFEEYYYEYDIYNIILSSIKHLKDPTKSTDVSSDILQFLRWYTNQLGDNRDNSEIFHSMYKELSFEYNNTLYYGTIPRDIVQKIMRDY
jgi:hypothetical protein